MTDERDSVGTAILHENDRVRVWEMRLEPGEACSLHKHRYDYVVVYVTPQNNLEVEWEGSEAMPIRADDGYVIYTGLGYADDLPAHRLRNVGTTLHRQIIVEFLGPTRETELRMEVNERK